MADARALIDSIKALAQFIIVRPTMVAIADDTAVTRMAHARLLQMSGCSVICFSDGADLAVDFASYVALGGQRSKYADLVLLDYDMPRLNGVATTGALRTSGFLGDVVVVTANADATQACMDAGATQVVPKPLTKALLSAVVADLSHSSHHSARSLSRITFASTAQHAFSLTAALAAPGAGGVSPSVIRSDELESTLEAAHAHLDVVLTELAAKDERVSAEIAELRAQLAASKLQLADGAQGTRSIDGGGTHA